jgi:hypothetical protein
MASVGVMLTNARLGTDFVNDNPILRRFWFRLEGSRELGYGVTAWTEEDAAFLIRYFFFKGGPLPKAIVTADVDVPTLDAGHVLPNMESPNWRGVWYPRGFAGMMARNWPVKKFERADGKARLFIMEREDGLFSFEGEREEQETRYETRHWTPCDAGGLFPTAEAAEREARKSISWLRDQDSI